MELDEAIAHAKEVAEMNRKEAEELREYGEHVSPPYQPYNIPVKACLDCATEHEQLAAWLEELKEYREGKRVCLWCKYDNNECNEYPCNVCKHNHPVMFEHKESEDK